MTFFEQRLFDTNNLPYAYNVHQFFRTTFRIYSQKYNCQFHYVKLDDSFNSYTNTRASPQLSNTIEPSKNESSLLALSALSPTKCTSQDKRKTFNPRRLSPNRRAAPREKSPAAVIQISYSHTPRDPGSAGRDSMAGVHAGPV